MVYCDAHFHIVQCQKAAVNSEQNTFMACSCAHGESEFGMQEKYIRDYAGKATIVPAFGIHPQLCIEGDDSAKDIHGLAVFMESLLQEKRIAAIGEAGFDFFTKEYAAGGEWQEEAWHVQCALAAAYKVPLIVHDRKALDNLFRDKAELAKIPAVVFHSFAFGPREALSLLDHGISSYFSFGKQLLNGNKKSIACVKELPADVLLLETDAPFQTLKGETRTEPEDIMVVYKAMAEIRRSDDEEVERMIYRNFKTVFESSQDATVFQARL